MERTQILLDPTLKKELTRLSRLSQTSISELIRKAVRAHLKHFGKGHLGLGGLVALLKEADLDQAPRTLSSQIDQILYRT